MLRERGELELAQRALGAACDGDEAQATVTQRALARDALRALAPRRRRPRSRTRRSSCCACATATPAPPRTNRLDDDGLRAAAQRARAAAAAAARSGTGEYPGLPAAAPTSRPARASTPRPPRSTRRRRPQRCARPSTACAAAGLEAFGHLDRRRGAHRDRVLSRGIALTDGVTDAHLKVIARDERGRSGYAAATAVASSEIDAGRRRRAAIEAARAGEPVELAPGALPASCSTTPRSATLLRVPRPSSRSTASHTPRDAAP